MTVKILDEKGEEVLAKTSADLNEKDIKIGLKRGDYRVVLSYEGDLRFELDIE